MGWVNYATIKPAARQGVLSTPASPTLAALIPLSFPLVLL